MCKRIQKGHEQSETFSLQSLQEEELITQTQPLFQQPVEDAPPPPQQVDPGAASAVMNPQQQNARNKKERRFLRDKAKADQRMREERQQQLAQWQETARQLREEQIKQDIQEGTRFLETEEQQKALKRTTDASVVSNVTAGQAAQHGCASYHQTVVLEEAKRAAEESGGFLYYKEVAPGLAELRPTLPKTLKINGEEVPLRRTYNLLIREIARHLVDENGKLLPDAWTHMDNLDNAIGDIGMDPGNVEYEKWVAKGTEELRAYMDEESISAIKAISKAVSSQILPKEIIGQMKSTVERLQALGDMSPQGIQERLRRMEQAMLEQNGGAPLTQEQLAQLVALPLLYEDGYNAAQELAALRNLDPDSPDVPLPNACSANADFQRMLRPLANKNFENKVEYETKSHLAENPGAHIQFVIDKIDWIAEKRSYSDAVKAKRLKRMKELKKKLDEGRALTPGEMDEVAEITVVGETAPCKYAYHHAGVVGVVNDNSDDCIIYTVETFAAETKQYMVSPFTRNIAVGRYRGRTGKSVSQLRTHEGMTAYYNLDNPIPNDEERMLSDLKVKLATGTLPGDQPRQ